MQIDCLCAGGLFADVACCPLDRLPKAGELLEVERIQLGLGGCAANAALDLARLGVGVGVSGCVGSDVFGQFIVDQLAAGGVQTDGVHRLDDTHSACTMIVNVKDQDRRFISTFGANHNFRVEHIPPTWARQARVIYLGGYLMLPSLETQGMVELLREARRGGAKVLLDVVGVLSRQSFDRLATILPQTDVFLPNEDEAAALTGLSDPLQQAETFRQAGAATVVITRGEQGSLLVADRLRLRAGVYPTRFVGGTGAGDAFDAGYAAGLLSGEDPAGCLRWGSALGASCVRSIGATESVFNRPQAEQYMQEHTLAIKES